jgi:hypothetical protein
MHFAYQKATGQFHGRIITNCQLGHRMTVTKGGTVNHHLVVAGRQASNAAAAQHAMKLDEYR